MKPVHEWRIEYDRRARVWRGHRGDLELNQYTKEELLWQVEHYDVPHLQEFILPNRVKALGEKKNGI